MQIGVSVALKNQYIFKKAAINSANAKVGQVIETEDTIKQEAIKPDPDFDDGYGDVFINTLLHALGCK